MWRGIPPAIEGQALMDWCKVRLIVICTRKRSKNGAEGAGGGKVFSLSLYY